MLTVALPKRQNCRRDIGNFWKNFGTAFRFDDRKLILEADGFRFLLVRNQDVPAYVLHQSADIGVVGLDVLEEKDEDLLRLLILVLENVKYV